MSYYERIKNIQNENNKLSKLNDKELEEIFIKTFKRQPQQSKNEIHSQTKKIKKDIIMDKIKRERLSDVYEEITGKKPAPAYNLYNLYNEKKLNNFLSSEMSKRKGKAQIEEVKEIKETPEEQMALVKKERQARFEKGVSPSRELTIQEYNRPKQQYKKPEIKTIKDIQEKADQLTFNPAFKDLLNKQSETIIKTNDYLRPKKDEKKVAIQYIDEEYEKRQKQKKLKKPKEEEERPISEFQYERMIDEAKEQERIKQRERDEFYFPPVPAPQVFPNQNLNIDEFEKIGEPEYQTEILKEIEKPKKNKPVFSSEKVERNYFDILRRVREEQQKDMFKKEQEEENRYFKGQEFIKQQKRQLQEDERKQQEREVKKEARKEKESQRGHETKTQLISEGFKLGGKVVETAGALGREAIGGYFSKETQKLKGEQEIQLKQLEADLLRKSKEHELELKQKALPYELEREEKFKNINIDRENRLKDIEIEKIKAIGEIDIKKAKVGAKATKKLAQLENASALNRQIQAQIHSQAVNTNTLRPYEPLSMLSGDRRPDDHRNMTIPMKGEGIVQIINKPVYTRTPTQRRATRTRKPKQLKTGKIKLSKSRL